MEAVKLDDGVSERQVAFCMDYEDSESSLVTI